MYYVRHVEAKEFLRHTRSPKRQTNYSQEKHGRINYFFLYQKIKSIVKILKPCNKKIRSCQFQIQLHNRSKIGALNAAPSQILFNWKYQIYFCLPLQERPPHLVADSTYPTSEFINVKSFVLGPSEKKIKKIKK